MTPKGTMSGFIAMAMRSMPTLFLMGALAHLPQT
jgi:hypothetical protein